MFCSHLDFDAYHQGTGKVCDYAEMKTEMLAGLSLALSADLADLPDLDIDASWLDFGDVFESVVDGIGEFVSAIFDIF